MNEFFSIGWQENADDRFAREQLCRIIAREIGFDGGHSDKLAVDKLKRSWTADQTVSFPHAILEGLVSSGVLQWAEGVSTIRFFHQTFLEYAAAYDLLSSNESVIEKRTESLLGEVANFRLFRAPILKQFAIQAFENGNHKWKDILQGLREIDNELAARMALEIVGKLPNDAFAAEICREWVRTSGSKLQNVICETVRHYPKNKTGFALDLLEPFLHGPKANMIYAACGDTFAKDAPAQVCEFLHRHLPRIVNASDDEQKLYKEALCSTLQHGAVEALAVLLDLYPHLKPGQRAGLLYRIAEVATGANAEEMAVFLRGVIDLMPEVKIAKQTEVWDGILQVAWKLYEVAPGVGSRLARWLIETGLWKKDQRTAVYTGMIASPAVSDLLEVERSLSAIASEDHFERLLNTGLLCNLPEAFSENLMELILSVEKELYQDEGQVGSLYTVVAGLRGVAPGRILKFLGEWPWQDSGVGTPLRRIIEYLAKSGPRETKDWLLDQLAVTDGAVSPKLFSAFNILLQADVNVFTSVEARYLYDTAFAASKTIKQIFAGTAGSIAKIDKQLAQEIFVRVFIGEGKDCQLAAVASLAGCLDDCPEFVFDQAGRVLEKAIYTNSPGILHSYLIVLKKLPQQHANELLRRLSDWFAGDVLRTLNDEKTVGELLTILKIICEAAPALAFDFSKRIPLMNKGVAGGLAALYDRISEYGEENSLLLELLDSVAEVSRFNQVRMRNALTRILPQVDKKLGGRYVVAMVLRTYKGITDEQALKTFMQAALKVPSWAEEDTMTLLDDSDLPGSVRALLAERIMR